MCGTRKAVIFKMGDTPGNRAWIRLIGKSPEFEGHQIGIVDYLFEKCISCSEHREGQIPVCNGPGYPTPLFVAQILLPGRAEVPTG